MRKKQNCFFDFVDIGTSYFDTSVDYAKSGQRILLVEPIREYLGRIKNPPGIEVVKENAAIMGYTGKGKIFYVDEERSRKYGLPEWVYGCNSIDVPHPTILMMCVDGKIPTSVIDEREIPVLTFRDLVEKHHIRSIGHLRIDTEGNDHVILADVIDILGEKKLTIDKITVEYIHFFGNTPQLDELFKRSGFRKATLAIDKNGSNVTLEEYA